MSVAVPVVGVSAPPPQEEERGSRWQRYLVIGLGVFLLISLVRVLTGAHEMSSSGTLKAALIAAIPIALAGLGGLWSERAGVVNIGLEGMMMLGALGAGYLGYSYGAVAGILGALVFGALGAALHGIVTVYFGVDHIVSGVAVNIIAAGLTAFLAKAFFTDLPGGGPTQSPPLPGIPELNLAFLSDPLLELQGKHWFVVSDVAAALRLLVWDLSLLTLLALALIAATAWFLWRTPFGLRLRSVGESPSAAESLGVNVYRYKLVAVLASGVFAGLGGAFLAMVSQSGYQNGMTQNMGYIGLAAMIFGNWRPAGLFAGALLFGYSQSIHLRGAHEGLHALLLVIAVLLFAAAAWAVYRKATRQAVLTGLGGVAFLVWFLGSDSVPRDFTGMAPYLTTLLVLAAFSQKLRMPAADGQVYRKGSAG